MVRRAEPALQDTNQQPYRNTFTDNHVQGMGAGHGKVKRKVKGGTLGGLRTRRNRMCIASVVATTTFGTMMKKADACRRVVYSGKQQVLHINGQPLLPGLAIK